MSAGDLRRQAIQEAILRDLSIRWQVAADLPLLWQHLLYGFETATVPYSEDEIRAALADLVERGLAAVSDVEGVGALPEKGYTATPDGRDFLAARCPWRQLGRFSGGGGRGVA